MTFKPVIDLVYMEIKRRFNQGELLTSDGHPPDNLGKKKQPNGTFVPTIPKTWRRKSVKQMLDVLHNHPLSPKNTRWLWQQEQQIRLRTQEAIPSPTSNGNNNHKTQHISNKDQI